MTNRYQLPDCRGCAFCRQNLEQTLSLPPRVELHHERQKQNTVEVHHDETPPYTPPKSAVEESIDRQKQNSLRLLRKQLMNTSTLIASLNAENQELRRQLKEKELECRECDMRQTIASTSFDEAENPLSSFFLRLFMTAPPSPDSKSTKENQQYWRMIRITSKVAPGTTQCHGAVLCNN